MTQDMISIWRGAALWPEGKQSLVERAIAGSAFPKTDPPDFEQSNEHRPIVVAAISQFQQRPENADAIRNAYGALNAVALSPFGSIESWDIVHAGIKSWTSDETIGQFFDYVLSQSPDRLAVYNAMWFLHLMKNPVQSHNIKAIGLHTDELFADRACGLAFYTELSIDQQEELAFQCAKAGTDFCVPVILKAARPTSSRDLKDWLLQQLVSAPQPSFTYVIDDYIDVILEYTEKGDLLSALKNPDAPDWLIQGGLELYAEHICRGLDRDVIWSEPGDEVEELESLFLLIERASERELPITSLEHLTQIYGDCFAYGHTQKLAGNLVAADSDIWLKDRASDIRAGELIVSTLNSSRHKDKIVEALESVDHPNFGFVLSIIEQMEWEDKFEILFRAVQNGTSQSCLPSLRGAVETPAQAKEVLDWAMSAAGVDKHGYVRYHRAGQEKILKHLIPLAAEFPGEGGALILAGLTNASSAEEIAANALLAWPTEMWPEGAGSHLRQAIKNNARCRDLFHEATARLPPKDA